MLSQSRKVPFKMSNNSSPFLLSYLNLLFYPLTFEKDLSSRFCMEFSDWIELLKTKHSMNEEQVKFFINHVLTSTGWKDELATTQDMIQSENELKDLIRIASIKLNLL